MASLVPQLVSANEDALRRGMERQVLALLHRARNPEALAAAPLMHAICAETGMANPAAALERIVLTVFDGDDESSTRLRSAIFDVDFNRAATNAELARKNGVSRRHFQRRRAEAVAALAQYARSILERSSRTPRRSTGSKRAARLFDRERAAFLRARGRGALLEMRSIAGNMARLAADRAERIYALECRADANARLGRADEAAEHLHRLSPSARLLVTAKLSLLAGRLYEAQECARAALRAMDGADCERYRSLTIVSQTSLLLAIPWRPPTETSKLSPGSWERIAMSAEHARHLAREGEWRAAESLARSAYRQAESFGYEETAARTAAVMHATAMARADSAEARRWRAQALRRLLPTQDRVLATGLFPNAADAAAPEVDDVLGGVLYERLCLIVPQMQRETDGQRDAVRDLIAAILNPLLSSRKSAPCIENRVEAVARCDSAFAHYAGKLVEPIHEMLTLALMSLTGDSWNGAFDALRDPLAEVVARARPAAPRTIAVATARSQMAVTEHLRVNDPPSAGRRPSTEAFADLRVRLVSV